jgi:N-methylhydantoinase A
MTPSGSKVEPNGDPSWLLAVDVGGTFTDVSLVDLRTDQAVNLKVPTTKADPSAGFEAGVLAALGVARIAPGQVARVAHATTIATNAVLEGTGARAALVCTRGFRYVLEIGRHDGPRRESLFRWSKPARPIPPDRIVELIERVAPDGLIETPPDPADLDAIVAWMIQKNVESIAVSLIDSYANPGNEAIVAAHLRAALPSIPVSVSSDLLPTMREYERSMVTALNAFVMPKVGGYLRLLRGRLIAMGFDGPLWIMQSSGGLANVESIEERPVRTILSGPAAGVIGATEIARVAGFDRIISFDVGGTSTDVALVRGAVSEPTEDGHVGPWPVALPMLDIYTIGAGGGSIARVDGLGTITVGPNSAGATPGPACYGLGGVEPTVTDAHLVLGHIPDRLAAGVIRLDRAAAETAIRTNIAAPLGLDVLEAAHGIVQIVDDNMSSAVRLISVERGHDPAGFVLVAGGGAGPLHAAGVARLLGIRTVLVPRYPGVLSTTGLLVSHLRRDFVRTHISRLDQVAFSALERLFAELEAEAAAWYDDEVVSADRRMLARSLALRYPDQPADVVVPWPTEFGSAEDGLDRIRAAFETEHHAHYGYRLPDRSIEVVGVRVGAIATLDTMRLAPPAPTVRLAVPIAAQERVVYLDRDHRAARIPVLQRDVLPPRHAIAGPTIVEQADSTTFVPPGVNGTIDDFGNLRLSLGAVAALR